MMAAVVMRVSHIAAGQWGLLTTAQAEQAGITRIQLARLKNAGVLERLGRGVYVTTSTTGDEYLPLRAAWIALDPTRTAEERLGDPASTAVVSHTSAAGLHHLGDLLDDQHQFTSAQRKQTTRPGIITHRGDLPNSDVTIVEGLPVTTEERTIADLLAAGTDLEHVAQIIGQGVRRGVVDLNDLAAHLDSLAARNEQPNGAALVKYLLDVVDLSWEALTLEIAATPVGRNIFVSGQASALSEIIASIMKVDTPKMFQLDAAVIASIASLQPKIDMLQILGFNHLDLSRLTGAHALIQAMNLTTPLSESMDKISRQLGASPTATAIAEGAMSRGAQPLQTASGTQPAETADVEPAEEDE